MDLEAIRRLAVQSGIFLEEHEEKEMAEDMEDIIALMDRIREIPKDWEAEEREAVSLDALREDVSEDMRKLPRKAVFHSPRVV